jgi:glutamine amidotransferase
MIKEKIKIYAIDLGYGNKRSIQSLFENIQADLEWKSEPPKTSTGKEIFILCGVGSAGTAMDQMKQSGWLEFIQNTQRPVIGFCLGFQMMFEFLEEEGIHHGIGAFQGQVKKLDSSYVQQTRIPHTGWSKVSWNAKSSFILSDLDFYYAHSYAVENSRDAIAHSYGFVSAALKNNFLGFQFHPELSDQNGLQLMKESLSWALSYQQ